jgi:hypothetical protein
LFGLSAPFWEPLPKIDNTVGPLGFAELLKRLSFESRYADLIERLPFGSRDERSEL